MVSLLIFLVVGLVVATIAKALAPGRDPGAGITLLLGAVAQIVTWFVTRLIGWDLSGQVWLFFVSIGTAVVLLQFYRDSGLDERLARGGPGGSATSKTTGTATSTMVDRPPVRPPSLWRRIAHAPPWAAAGALLMGATGFVVGFFGPMQFQPWANQGPMVGIFLTGPGGVLLGGLVGGGLKIARPDWPARQQIWVLNAANVAWGLFVLDLVADSSWWH